MTRAHHARAVEAKPREPANVQRDALTGDDPGDVRDLRWPADHFLWAVVDGPGKAGPLAPGLWPQVVEQVHVEAESITAVAAPLGDGRTLVCAIERARLGDLPAGTLRLTPASLPACLDGPAPDPAGLDLLVGERLPPACRARSRLRHLLAAGGLTGVTLLTALGLSRRAEVWDRAAQDAQSHAAHLAAAIDPASTLADLPYLAEEAARQRLAITALGDPKPVAPLLADLIARWPADSPPATLVAEHDAVLATTLVSGDPGAFLAALSPPHGFRLGEPRLATLAGGTQITIVMQRVPEQTGSPAGGTP